MLVRDLFAGGQWVVSEDDITQYHFQRRVGDRAGPQPQKGARPEFAAATSSRATIATKANTVASVALCTPTGND